LIFAELTHILIYGCCLSRPSASSPDLNSQSYGFNTVSMNVSKYEEVLKDRDLSFLLEVIRNFPLCKVSNVGCVFRIVKIQILRASRSNGCSMAVVFCVSHVDKSILVVYQCFEGDLRGGMELVQSIFLQQKDTILEQLHYENRLLFGVYVVQVRLALNVDGAIRLWR
jgi:hypothetical protein